MAGIVGAQQGAVGGHGERTCQWHGRVEQVQAHFEGTVGGALTYFHRQIEQVAGVAVTNRGVERKGFTAVWLVVDTDFYSVEGSAIRREGRKGERQCAQWEDAEIGAAARPYLEEVVAGIVRYKIDLEWKCRRAGGAGAWYGGQFSNVAYARCAARRQGDDCLCLAIRHNSVSDDKLAHGRGIGHRHQRADGDGQLAVGERAIVRAIAFYDKLVGGTLMLEVQFDTVLAAGRICNGQSRYQIGDLAVLRL